VTLNQSNADGIAFSTINAQSGKNGDPTAFNSVFAGSWNLLGKISSSSGTYSTVIDGSTLTYTLSVDKSNESGTWSITSSKDMTLDLVFAMHASKGTGSFLFNDESLLAGKTETGTFNIDWLNNGNQVPEYSNLTLFYKDASLTKAVSPVPEPSTYAMFLMGLAGLGFIAYRRKKL
jgi:hypothetical protein